MTFGPGPYLTSHRLLCSGTLQRGIFWSWVSVRLSCRRESLLFFFFFFFPLRVSIKCYVTVS